MNRRIESIDIARALCIVLVVVGHYLPDNSPLWYITLNHIIYSFHMPLFMFVSGFVFFAGTKPLNYKSFVLNKIKRLAVPYFLVSALIITIKLFSAKYASLENPVTITDYLRMFVLPSAGYFLWFIYVLFLIFLIAPFFRAGNRIYILLAVSLIWLLAPLNTTSLFCLSELKRHLLFFVCGCILSKERFLREILLKVNQVALLAACILSFAALFICYQDISEDRLIIRSCIALCTALLGIAVILIISQQFVTKENKIKQLLLKLSIYSYTIYLFHTVFEGFAKSAMSKMPMPENLVFYVTAFVVIAVGLLAPIALYKIDLLCKTLIFNKIKK